MVPKDKSTDVCRYPLSSPLHRAANCGRGGVPPGGGDQERGGSLASYSRALSGCRGVRGLLPEPLCEMRTLQKHSLERDRESTGDAVMGRPWRGHISRRAKESPPRTAGRRRDGSPQHSVLDKQEWPPIALPAVMSPPPPLPLTTSSLRSLRAPSRGYKLFPTANPT